MRVIPCPQRVDNHISEWMRGVSTSEKSLTESTVLGLLLPLPKLRYLAGSAEGEAVGVFMRDWLDLMHMFGSFGESVRRHGRSLRCDEHHDGPWLNIARTVLRC